MKKSSIFIIAIIFTVIITETSFAKILVPGRTDESVNDYAGMLNEAQKKYITAIISTLDQKTPDRVEVIVSTFKYLDGWDSQYFAKIYGQQWRLIKRGRRDNGVILLLIIKEGRVLIGVGQNLNKILLPETVDNIIRYKILPAFDKNDYGGGIASAVKEIVRILNEANIPQDKVIFNSKTALIIVACFIIIGVIKIFLS